MTTAKTAPKTKPAPKVEADETEAEDPGVQASAAASQTAELEEAAKAVAAADAAALVVAERTGRPQDYETVTNTDGTLRFHQKLF